ncbi:MAG: GMC family oxidoreductase, partial [Acidimicrobiaceae bacterium]|nr:GMC family oxidoreductase [Acidimicrobiaceae bacterium]
FTPPGEPRPRPIGVGLLPRIRAGVRGQPVQARRAFFREQTSPFLVNDRQHPYKSEGEYFLWIRGRQLGGRLHSYGRVLLRMSDREFRGGAEVGGFGGGWPISYAELEPWYDRVEEFIGLYGNADGLPELPDGKYVGPARLTAVEEEFKAKVQGHWPERRVVSWRYAAPNPHRVPLGILAARKTGRLTTRTDSVVTHISIDEGTGQADGATFVDRATKQQERVTADIVVLCASTIESIRLLLNSACARHPHGLGNSSGLLGRYFMDQTPGLVFGSSPEHRGFELDDSAPADAYYPAAGGVYIPRFHNLDGRTNHEFAGGYSVQGAMGRVPVPDDHPAAFGLMSFGEMPPYHDNRITLDRTRKDAWGVPIPRIQVSLTENERALLREQVRGVREMVEYCGYRVNFAGSTLGLDSRKVFPDADPVSRFVFRRAFKKSLAIGAAIHECGGARMGDDPKASVLNRYNQLWDVPNIFVTDGSCYVTSGNVGPTLTIMALTARACDHLAREHETGSLSSRSLV